MDGNPETVSQGSVGIITVQLLFGTEKEWIVRPPMPTARVGAATFHHHGELWVSGGYSGHNCHGNIHLLSSEMKCWREEPWEAPFGRNPLVRVVSTIKRDYCLAVDGGEYCFKFTVDLKFLDWSSKQWVSSSLFKGRKHTRDSMTVVAWKGLLVCIGGCDDGYQVTNVVTAYDPVAQAWRPFPSLCAPRQMGAAVATPDGNILVLGGQGSPNGRNHLSSIECYDNKLRRWSPSSLVLPCPVNKLAAHMVDNFLCLVYSGERRAVVDQGRTDRLWLSFPLKVCG